MVHKHGKFLRLDRVVPGVGRIALSSGTDDAGMFRRINNAITGATAIGALDKLADLRDSVFTPIVFAVRYERGQLAMLPTKGSAADLVTTLETWAETHEVAEGTREDIGTSIRHVAKKARKGTSVQALPGIVRDLRKPMAKAPIAFNRLRAHMLAFARVEYGKRHAIYQGIEDVERYRRVEGKRPRKLQRRPLTVAELDAVCAAFEDHEYKRGNAKTKGRILAEDLTRMAYTLAFTGMRPQEYWQRAGATWDWKLGYIWVDGTKTAASKRPTFRIGLGTIPKCGEQFFRQAFAKATEKALREGLDAYSLRRTFAKLCEDAGVVQSRRETYMAHGPKTVDEIYLRTNVIPFVPGDAQQVEAFIVAEREQAKTPVLRLESK